ncbi:MAG: TetR/AcrR family transcriptional regulator [Planctomycetota bacterium]|jgi:AcrR family transcriptional regulator
MARRYDASRRRAQAQRTREQILDAAVELHGQGVTAYEPLADAAGVSVATVRKHFPNKEALFEGCTSHFFAALEAPRLDDAAALRDPAARLALVVAEMCRVHEASHDLAFLAAAESANSPTLAGALKHFGRVVEAAAGAILDGPGLTKRVRTAGRPRLRALLDSFTYRSFRVSTGLDAAAVQRELTLLIALAIGVTPPR